MRSLFSFLRRAKRTLDTPDSSQSQPSRTEFNLNDGFKVPQPVNSPVIQSQNHSASQPRQKKRKRLKRGVDNKTESDSKSPSETPRKKRVGPSNFRVKKGARISSPKRNVVDDFTHSARAKHRSMAKRFLRDEAEVRTSLHSVYEFCQAFSVFCSSYFWLPRTLLCVFCFRRGYISHSTREIVDRSTPNWCTRTERE